MSPTMTRRRMMMRRMMRMMMMMSSSRLYWKSNLGHKTVCWWHDEGEVWRVGGIKGAAAAWQISVWWCWSWKRKWRVNYFLSVAHTPAEKLGGQRTILPTSWAVFFPPSFPWPWWKFNRWLLGAKHFVRCLAGVPLTQELSSRVIYGANSAPPSICVFKDKPLKTGLAHPPLARSPRKLQIRCSDIEKR